MVKQPRLGIEPAGIDRGAINARARTAFGCLEGDLEPVCIREDIHDKDAAERVSSTLMPEVRDPVLGNWQSIGGLAAHLLAGWEARK